MPNSIIIKNNDYCHKPPPFVSDAKGREPKNASIASHSHYLDPLNKNVYSGNSRVWADADDRVKLDSINSIIDQSIKNNYSLDETSFVLSIAFIESGFNPDAAAASSSASGLGQFIDRTGLALGLDGNNRFSINENAKALVHHIKNLLHSNFQLVTRSSTKEQFIQTYSQYHDGLSVTKETKNYSAKKIPPLVNKFREYLLSKNCI